VNPPFGPKEIGVGVSVFNKGLSTAPKEPGADLPRDKLVKRFRWFGAVVLVGLALFPTPAGARDRPVDLEAVNQRLAGNVIDFTHNSGVDRRIWSPSLGEWRDLYVYVPPGFNPAQRYPIVLFLHPFLMDEHSFVDYVVDLLDGAIVHGTVPPVIVAAPDGSIRGYPTYFNTGSFFVNSNAGNFGDFLIHDVWDFVTQHFPIRREREAHVIAGASMGGFSAFNQGFNHPELFGVIVGMLPPVNLRWVNCRGRYMANFDPCCWGWRTQVDRGHEVVGRFYLGAVTIRMKRVIDPLFGRGPEALEAVKRENPVEMIDRLGIPPGLFDIYIAYAGRDEFNVDAQVESFLYVARERGLEIAVQYDPKGRHNVATARKMFPGVLAWLGPRLAPYSPP
jgi:S-formylglutathione hydrolase FrmB